MVVTLKAARINAGLTQEYSAKAVGVSPKTLMKWEKGITYPTTAAFAKLCSLYHAGTDDIFMPIKLG